MRARRLRALVAAVYVTLAFSVFTSVYDPLPDVPLAAAVALLALPSVGLGLVIGQWWAVALPALLALPWAIRGGDDDNALAYDLSPLDVVGLGAIGAVLAVAGVLAATAERSRPRNAFAVGGAALVAVALVPLAWAIFRSLSPVDERPARPLPVDVRAGSAGGAGLGDDTSAVRGAWGAGRASPTAPIAPLGEDFDSLAAPLFIETPGESHAVLRYRGASFLISDGRVYAVVVAARDAETVDGVGVGDSLELARDAYPALDCRTATRPDGRTFPYCTGRIAARRYAWFGDDPIRSITVAATKLAADNSVDAAGKRDGVELAAHVLAEGGELRDGDPLAAHVARFPVLEPE